MAAAPAWLVDLVRRYRALGFFQGMEDRGKVTGKEPGFAQVAIGLPLPAHGRMSDAAVAQLIADHHRADMGRDLEPEQAPWAVPDYDPFRWARLDAECVGPGEDAYVDALLAVARVSRGAFAPTDIREEWDGEEPSVAVSFRHAGRLHTLTPKDLGDLMDTGFLAYVNDLMAQSPYQLYCPETGDQTFAVVALAPAEREPLAQLLGAQVERPQRTGGGSVDALEREARDRFVAVERESVRLEEAGRNAAAMARCRDGIALARAQAERNPSDAAFFLYAEMACQSRLGALLQRADDHAAAAQAFRRGLDLRATLLAEFPAARDTYNLDGEGLRFRFLLVDALGRLGQVDEALALWDTSRAELEAHAKDAPAADLAMRRGLLHEQRAILLEERDAAGALAEAQEAIRHFEAALREEPDERMQQRLDHLRTAVAQRSKRRWWKLR